MTSITEPSSIEFEVELPTDKKVQLEVIATLERCTVDDLINEGASLVIARYRAHDATKALSNERIEQLLSSMLYYYDQNEEFRKHLSELPTLQENALAYSQLWSDLASAIEELKGWRDDAELLFTLRSLKK